MRPLHNTARLGVLAVALAAALPALGAEPSVTPAQLQSLLERMERLEKRNSELEKALQVQTRTADTKLEQRVMTLETQNKQLEAALASESISEQEPELATRLKYAENQAQTAQAQSRMLDALGGFSIGADFVGVAQGASGIGNDDVQLNYRADLSVTSPTITTGDVDSFVFALFRAGQGNGVDFTSFVGPNATAFQLGSVVPADNSALIVGELWYQADIPLPFNGYKPQSRETLTLNFGKMDPFGFFDQNNVGGDETTQFLASAFVHNALLDNPLAANVGADGYGFSPGVRIGYTNASQKPESYGLSLGVFASGDGADFSGPFTKPFVIAQAETSQRFFGGLEGNYRAYLWSNGQAPTFIADQTENHWGWGISADQRVGDGFSLFGRAGMAYGDNLPFDVTASLGGEFNGSYWSRGSDAIGLAYAANRVASDFHDQSAGLSDYGYTADGWEQTLELYYRFQVHPQFELTPDLQYIRHPAGNTGENATVYGLRTNLSF